MISLTTREYIEPINLLELVLPNVFGFNTNVTPSNGLINNLILNSILDQTTYIFGDVLVKKDYLYIDNLTDIVSKHLRNKDKTDKIILSCENFYNNLEIVRILRGILQKFYGIDLKISFDKDWGEDNKKVVLTDSFHQDIRKTIDNYMTFHKL